MSLRGRKAEYATIKLAFLGLYCRKNLSLFLILAGCSTSSIVRDTFLGRAGFDHEVGRIQTNQSARDVQAEYGYPHSEIQITKSQKFKANPSRSVNTLLSARVCSEA